MKVNITLISDDVARVPVDDALVGDAEGPTAWAERSAMAKTRLPDLLVYSRSCREYE